jgi:hypothetical protein
VNDDHQHSQRAEPNRLAQESSPYLLLHQYNPVDWYPWGPEAIEKARREDKPIFLSVGYSTCYWCHVMERQSFSDPEIAALMNRSFVSIKVDREERPDLDEIYMAATQLLTGHGGWPNSVFLTPELKPFYAGTYFPPRDQHGRPGFATLLVAMQDAWKSRRSDVKSQAEEVASAVQRYLEDRNQPGKAPPDPAVAGRALDSLARRYDARWGGFGGAPKFPTPANLLLLREMAGERPEAAEMLAATLDQMARGGIYDQLAGGFHRYATDQEWKVPHFEKMLYDNGLLLELYADEHARTGDAQLARIARETADFLIREMTSEAGGFWSAIDAETDGEEGAYYVWTRDELNAALGAEDATFLAPLLGFDGAPFFEGDHYVLHLPETIAEQAKRRRMTREELLGQLRPLRDRLLAVRSRRERPLTDDKVLADWNGMAIGGMAAAGAALGDDDLVARARRAADFVLAEMRGDEGLLLHTWRAGKAKIPAYLGDYAFFVHGLLRLHAVTGEERWLTAAAALTDQQIDRLRDEPGGYFVAAENADLMARSKDMADGATPSPNAVAVLNLLDLAAATGEPRWRREARAALTAFAPLVEQMPEGTRTLTVAARRFAAQEPAGEISSAAAASQSQEGHPPESHPQESGSQAPSEIPATLVTAQLEAPGEPDADGWRTFRMAVTITEGWHVNANPASDDFLIATELAGEGAELAQLVYPAGESVRFAFAEEALSVYQGKVEIRGRLRATGDEAALVLRFQPCDESRCLPPEELKVRL